jgi:hypothetical protein
MDSMPSPASSWAGARRDAYARKSAGARCRLFAVSLAAALTLIVLLLPGCKRLHLTDTRPLDQAGMWYGSIQELRTLGVTDAEVAELAKARQAGVSDAACVNLVRLAHGREQPFADGDAVAGLRRVGLSESTTLELARLGQFGLWAGETQAMHLAGLSDQILLGVARRHAAGQPVPSGASLAQLKDAGMSEAEMLDLIQHGTTDQQAQEMIEAHRRATASTGFVRYHRRRRR